LGELARTHVTDSLTGVGNRRLGDLLLQSLSKGDAIALLDLDHFKRVNDTFGHPEGDRVLTQFGDYLQRSLRENDAVARMGGEEFLLLLRSANQGAFGAVERLLAGWNATSPLVTVSAGVALHDRHGTPQRTYAAADTELYQAKSLGRDRVIMTGANGTLHLHTAAA
jgi:diguanylate cyclase (GGDEF)-like protein